MYDRNCQTYFCLYYNRRKSMWGGVLDSNCNFKVNFILTNISNVVKLLCFICRCYIICPLSCRTHFVATGQVWQKSLVTVETGLRNLNTNQPPSTRHPVSWYSGIGQARRRGGLFTFYWNPSNNAGAWTV